MDSNNSKIRKSIHLAVDSKDRDKNNKHKDIFNHTYDKSMDSIMDNFQFSQPFEDSQESDIIFV